MMVQPWTIRDGAAVDSDSFKAALNALGFTQSKAAKMLGVHPRTVRKWAQNETPVPGPVVACLKLLARDRDAVLRVHARKKGDTMVTQVEDAWNQLLPHLGHLPPEVGAAAITLYQQATLVGEGGGADDARPFLGDRDVETG